MADYQQNFMNALQSGLQFGQQIKGIQDQRQLGQLAGQAYGAPRDQRQSLLGQLAQISPEAAAQTRKQWSADDENDQQELVNMARFIKAAPPEQQMQVYQSSVLPKLRERGMQAPDWTPETQQTILQTVDALVNAYGGAGTGSQVQSTRVGADGYYYTVNRQGQWTNSGIKADPNAQIVEGEGGFFNVDKRANRAAPVTLGGAPPTGNPITGTNFGIKETNDYVQSILSKAGNIDPNATPEQQAEALLPYLIQQESGGDPNAVSPKGAQGLTQVMQATGEDPGFGVQPLRDNSPQENVRFGRDYLTAMLRRYPGRVDLALAAYNAGPGVADRFAGQTAQAGQGQQLRPAPKAAAQSELDRRIAIARDLGATPDQIRNMALGSAAPDAAKQATATEVKEATARRLKIPQLANLERGIGNIEDALLALDEGMIGTGPATARLLSVTPEGQRLETAVGAIQESLLSLTRVPGIGAQSDLEARIANLKYPQTGNYAQNNKMLIDNLRSIVKDIGDAYRSLQADDDAIIQSRSRQPQRIDDGGDDIDALLEIYR